MVLLIQQHHKKAELMSEPRAVFSRALFGCQQLQRAFPDDIDLRKIIEQLQFWMDRDATPQTTLPLKQLVRMTSMNARNLKPLNEDVACWVYDAAATARRLQSSAHSLHTP